MLGIKIWLIAGAFLGSYAYVHGQRLQLTPNGGYNVVVAVEKDTPPPENPVIYMNKVQMIFKTMSAGMFYNTKKRFHINSVDLLVPDHWNMYAAWPATTQSYRTGDVRISDKFQYLRAENPNACGLPGHYVETPLDFFANAAWDSYFGTPWKAFMTQWARYRYGIWEEHGYPGDGRFPYFYQKLGEKGWLTTGCSDIDIEGQYLTLNNETCDVTGEAYPGDNCRFFPERETSLATSSIMHMHFIENVIEFCDETTHNREAPNRHNRNCGHRSAWEVIRDTPDYLSVTEPPPYELPKFDVFVYSDPPRPDILVFNDVRSNNQVSERIRLAALKKLGEIFNPRLLHLETVGKIISFPSPPSSKSNSLLNTVVEWSYVKDEYKFIEGTASASFNSSSNADIASGILAAVQECVDKNNPFGCILVVLKAGDITGNSAATNEEDVLDVLEKNPGITLYAIEMSDNPEVANLQRLAKVSGGRQVSVATEEDVERKLRLVLQDIMNLCLDPKLPNPATIKSVFRGILEPNEVNEISVIAPEATLLEFRLTTATELTRKQLYFYSGSVVHAKTSPFPTVTVVAEWNASPPGKYVYSWSVNVGEGNKGPWRIYYECEETLDSCHNAVLHVNDLTAQEEDNDGIVLELFASETVVDMARVGFGSNSPLNIFVSAHKYGQPIVDLDVTVTVEKEGQSWIFPLLDNGLANPDLLSNDGIYSASFIPLEDGDYEIFATVRTRECSEAPPSNGIRLFLPDQKNFGCFPNNMNREEADAACVGIRIEGKLQKFISASEITRVINSNKFVAGKPYRTLDLRGNFDGLTGSIALTFTSPGVVSGDAEAATYRIYHSSNHEALKGEGSESLLFNKISYPAKPAGDLEILTILPERDAVMFYAIQTTNNGLNSGLSNIICLGQ